MVWQRPPMYAPMYASRVDVLPEKIATLSPATPSQFQGAENPTTRAPPKLRAGGTPGTCTVFCTLDE